MIGLPLVQLIFVLFAPTRRTPYINNNLGSTTTTTACPPTQSGGASGSNNPSTFHQTHTGTNNNSNQFSTISPNHHGRSSTPTSAATSNTHNNSSSNISDHDRSDTGRSRNTQQHLPKEERRMQGIILALYFVVCIVSSTDTFTMRVFSCLKQDGLATLSGRN